MTAELGHFATLLAFFLALLQSVIPLAGAHRNQANWMAAGIPMAIGQFLLIGFAFTMLSVAFITSDFSVSTSNERFRV